MKVAILAPGPSLARLEILPPYDVTIAVNRAVLIYECTWWAALDYPMLRDNQSKILGAPSLLTRRQTYMDLHRRLRHFPEVRIVEDIPGTAGMVKSITCAMVFAQSLGAKIIDVYGADMAGEADYDGVKAGEDRSEARWVKERIEFESLTSWLGTKGVEVRRV